MSRTALAPRPSASNALSAMVLAGGQSRRMGQDKALLPIADGQPLLLRTVQIAQSLTPNVAVVTPWPERYQPLLPKSVELIKEPSPPANSSTSTSVSAGPLSGFAHGWSAISTDWCLLLACDLPYLDPLHLQRWWSWLLALDSASPEPIPVASLAPITPTKAASRKSWEPLCGYYHRRCLPSLAQHLASGQQSFQSWLSKIPIAPYESMPKRSLFNCNTPADWSVVKDE